MGFMTFILKLQFVVALVTLSLAHVGEVSGEPVEDISMLLANVREEHQVPGMVAAVADSDGVIALGAVGNRKNKTNSPITTDDCFHIGSCTKSMTATMCAMLVEDGKLKWTTTVAESLPNLAEKIHPDFRSVTLEQLLCHRSGLPEDRKPDLAIWPRIMTLKGDLRDQRRSLVELVMGRPPEKAADTAFAYSNMGFTIAGAMAEGVTGESYETLMKKRLFNPLGMKSAGFGAPAGGTELKQPVGHDYIFGMYSAVPPGPGSDNPPVITPAGCVHCSITDWAKYAMLHLRAARGKPKLLKAETFKKLHTDVHDQHYAFGWAIVDDAKWANGPVLAHDGSNGRWYAAVVIAPKVDLALLVATNAADETAQNACRDARKAMRERFIKSSD